MPFAATQTYLPADFKNFLDKLEAVSEFAKRVPRRNMKDGKPVVGMSRTQVENILKSHNCNFEIIEVGGYKLVYCPSGTPEYTPKPKPQQP